MHLIIAEADRATLAAILDAIDTQDAKAAEREAEAEKARAAAVRIRQDAEHPELQAITVAASPSDERLSTLMKGETPPPLDHRERAKLRAANEERDLIRRQMLTDADALEQRAGALHAEAEKHRAKANEQRGAFIQGAGTAVHATLVAQMRHIALHHVQALVGLQNEARRIGVHPPGQISYTLGATCFRYFDVTRQDYCTIWPRMSDMLVTGDLFDAAAGYAQLIAAIRSPADSTPPTIEPIRAPAPPPKVG